MENLSQPDFLQRLNKWIVMSSINSMFLDKEKMELKELKDELRQIKESELKSELKTVVPKSPESIIQSEIEKFENLESHSFSGNVLDIKEGSFVRRDLTPKSDSSLDEVVDIRAEVVPVKVTSETLNGKKRFYIERLDNNKPEKSISKEKAFEALNSFVAVSPKFNEVFNLFYGNDLGREELRESAKKIGSLTGDLKTARNIIKIAESIQDPKQESKKDRKRKNKP